ncbi:MAG: hypothetical protein D6678_01730 [Zetaproteobacteria bacterium]|nr:MAG: hypothetical protein D6678_01730 [Zetaproteobacteria bacterium]
MLNETVRGVSWVALANVATKLLWAATTVVLLHYLDTGTYGWLATVWATASLFASVSDLGTGQAMLRFASTRLEETRALLMKALAIKSACMVPLVACLTAVLENWGAPETVVPSWLVIFVAVAGQSVDSYQQLFTYVCQTLRRLDLFAIGRSLYFLALFLGVALLAGLHLGIFSIVLLQLAASGLFIALFAHAVVRLLPQSATSPTSHRDLLRWGRMFFLCNLLNLAYYRADVMVLAAVSGEEAAGVYSAQYQLILLLYALSGMMFSVVAPDMYRRRSSRGFLQEMFDRLCRYLNLAAVCAMPVMLFFSQDIMRVLGGDGYAATHESLRILALFALLLPAAVALNILTITDRLSLRLTCDVLGVAITVVLGWALSREFGVSGMAIAAVTGYLAAGMLGMVLMGSLEGIRIRTYIRDLTRMSMATLLACPALFIGLPMWVAVPAYLLGLAFALTATGFWDEGDKRVVQAIRHTLRARQA